MPKATFTESAELTVHKAHVYTTLGHGFSIIYAVKKRTNGERPKTLPLQN